MRDLPAPETLCIGRGLSTSGRPGRPFLEIFKNLLKFLIYAIYFGLFWVFVAELGLLTAVASLVEHGL